MFTGIIQAIGELRSMQTHHGGDVEMAIAAPGLDLGGVALGDSIAVSGCCLTVTRIEGDVFAADVSVETLEVTTLGQWRIGQPVNLEKALCAGQPLGGHYVTGHVDGIATVVATEAQARSLRAWFEVPAALARYIARKGSVCIDGISLTVNEVDGARFCVNLIPHTLQVTSLGRMLGRMSNQTPGQAPEQASDQMLSRASGRLSGGTDDGIARVNLEVDIIARYVERLAAPL
ncbi:riboflavin synthase subunit alpha [Steroidobacter denitrificans]|uniref:Riboflavin synthase n=1 Tax=Steroidobacter denitrificans TaxID=465721 RepID=A0A127FD42_STEDE|nr:riboflavin synthase [Steroidobacter denitrificans]AMN47519.1 riboflavin synthase subunit alpha [Steroidobacter denitrificans]